MGLINLGGVLGPLHINLTDGHHIISQVSIFLYRELKKKKVSAVISFKQLPCTHHSRLTWQRPAQGIGPLAAVLSGANGAL